MVSANKRQRTTFKVVIVGAGLGGLGAALALARKGHDVTVLEAARALNEVGAGIQIPPNSTRILCKEWGLKEILLEKIVQPNCINMRRYSNGEIIGSTPLDPILTEKYGFPYWLIHRADYQRILYDAAIESGAKVHLGSRVASVEENPPCVTLCSGERFEADVIIGADGIRSRVRCTVMDEEVLPRSSSNCAFRATIPAEIMHADPELSKLMTEHTTNLWIGYRRHLMAYPMRGGTLYNMVLSHPGEAEPGKWNEPGNLEELRWHYRKFDPIVQKLCSKITSCLKWKLADLPVLDNWVSPQGTIVLIGDAAHATLPYLAAGAAMAIEDAATIAECLDRASSVIDVPDCLKAFEKIRRRRCEKIVKGSVDSEHIWHMPDGEEQEERDANIKMDAAIKNAQNAAAVISAKIQKKGPNPNSWSDDEFQPWWFGHDTVKHANDKLDEILGTSSRIDPQWCF